MNIDADLGRAGGADLSRTDETLVETTNGCICCTLRDDLLQEVRRLAQQGRFDHLVIESTGISEPLPVAATFDFRDEDGASLGDVARIDTMVTVVDAANLLRDFSSTDFLRDRGETAGDAAFAVGYESVPQFTREYGRMFGLPPVRDTKAAMGKARSAA